MDLFDLVRHSDLQSLRTALSNGADPNAASETNDTPLIVAAEINDQSIVDALMDAGAHIDQTNDYGFSALSTALWCSHMSLARHLESRGALVSIECSAALGDLARLKTEWHVMPPTQDTIGAFLCSCRTGQTEVIRWFLDQGMPVDLHPAGAEWGGIGCPGLHHAAVNGHVESARILVDHGADLTITDDVHGSEALAWAASGGKPEVVEFLIGAGADIQHKNSHGLTARDLALSNGFRQLADRLDNV